MADLLASLGPRDAKTGLVHVVIDTPRGSRNKYKYDLALGCFKLSRILPVGHAFPYDFGSIPGTCAADGDALDVLVLMEAPTFPGCLVTVKLIGAIAARQTERRKTIRNDRLVGVPRTPTNKPTITHLKELGSTRIREIEHFFTAYNAAQGRRFEVTARLGPERAEKLAEAGIARYRRKSGG